VVFPPSCGVFLPPPLLQAFWLQLLVVCRRSCLLQQLIVRDFPSPLRHSGRPTLFAMCLFCCYCLLFSFFLFFPLGGGRSVQGAMLLWPRLVCGSTVYRLAHLVVCIFPSRLGAGVWWHRGPPGFSIQCEVEMLCAAWRCGGVKVLPLLGGFSCKVCLRHLSKILF
jgi:hypothetical protein